MFLPKGYSSGLTKPLLGPGQSQRLSKQRFLVPGEFSKWDFMEDSVREPSRLFVRVHTHPSSSSPWHLQPEFPTQNHIQIYNAEEPIRSEASVPAHQWGRAPLLIFLLKSEHPRAHRLSKYIIRISSLQGKQQSAICRMPIVFQSLTYSFFSKQ